jgi:hypothetical protein
MTEVEFEIINFLKQSPDAWFNRREIARKARRREEFEENPHWANAALTSLVDQKQVIQNDSGLYRLSPGFERK